VLQRRPNLPVPHKNQRRDCGNRRPRSWARAIAHLRTQLALLSEDNSRRDGIYRDLLWCYQEAFALLYRQIAARRAAHTARLVAAD
jgi:hypothetical protein